jgi:hypothetical protein
LWLSGFDARQSVSISGSPNAGTDYQVRVDVTYDSDMLPDFGDIRFTDNDGQTELDYWLESYTASTSALFWVEVADSLATAGTIYMYYRNTSVVSTASDGPATFVLFDDFNDGSINATLWDTNQAPSESGGLIVLSSAATSEMIISDDTFDQMRTRGNISLGDPSSTYGGRYGWSSAVGGAEDQDATIWQVNPTETSLRTDNDIDQESTTMGDFGEAYHIYQLDWSDIEVVCYIDDVLEANHTTYIPDDGEINKLQLQSYRSGCITYGDWVFISKYTESEPQVQSFGAEEKTGWNNAGTVTVYLVIYDTILMWGLDTLYVLAGLVLMPMSTMYLVKGGRKSFSAEKMFYFLVVFIFGFALFVGGIMP